MALKEITKKDLDSAKGLSVLEIYKPGCKPCQQLEPILEKVSQQYSGKIAFYGCDFVNEEVIRQLGEITTNYPIMVLLKDGKVVEHFTGAKATITSGGLGERTAAGEDYFKRRLDKFIEHHYVEKEIQTPIQLTCNPTSLESKLGLSDNTLITLEERYLRKNEQGKIIEAPEDLFRRVASNIAQADTNYGKNSAQIKQTEEEFYNLMANLIFMPNSPTLMNAGRDLQQLSACFVLPVEDSIDGIFGAAKEGSIVHKSGGGTGYDFSKLRPRGSQVKTTKGVSSGPVSFMYAFNVYTDVVKQGGTRRGANMGILRVDHPDIQEFVHSKGELDEKNLEIINDIKKQNNLDDDDPYVISLKRKLIEKTQLNNFNISVGLTKEFMQAVKEDSEFPLVDPHSKMITKKIKARDLLEEIVDQAWKSGDPGVVFLDKMNEYNPTPHIGIIESTNPCGEQPLLPYESCNLGSINLAKFVKNNNVDYDGLKKTVHSAVHFLDNVIDMNKYPIEQISKMTRANRKIGLGIMGFADMTTMLEIPYDSESSIKLAESVMKFIRDEARNASIELAKERGVFPNWKGSIYDSESKYFKGEELKLRNATLTTIAPTGTLSMIADCESGIEPSFSLAYTKTVMDGKVLHYRSRGLEYILKQKGFDVEEIFSELETGKMDKLKSLPEEIKKLIVTSMTLSPEQHIKVQAAFQRYTDNAVSKTVNLPKEATREDIKNTYLLAYQLGCKGITIYRDGSKDVQILQEKVNTTPKWGSPLPKERIGIIRQEKVGDGKTVFITTGYFESPTTERMIKQLRENGTPTEFFVDSNFFDADTQSLLVPLAVRTSKDLRKGIPIEEIVGDLKKVPPANEVGYDSGFEKGGEYVNRSISDAIWKALTGWRPPIALSAGTSPLALPVNSPEIKQENNPPQNNGLGLCSNCSQYGVVRKEGCDTCLKCGFSQKGCS